MSGMSKISHLYLPHNKNNIMYKIKDKYKEWIAKYAFTKLDINGVYSLEEWTKAGFKISALELVSQ
jgi:hypothetical protein